MSNQIINFEDEKNKQLMQDLCKAQSLTAEEFRMFVFVCKERKLNPLLNHIYAIKRSGKMTIQVGIDGYRVLADRTGAYMPGRAPTYAYKGDVLFSATAYVKKHKQGEWHEVEATAHLDEYCVAYNGKPSGQWGKMPHVMLAKCAEASALRRAFAAELSGVYTQEEMGQAEVEVKGEDIIVPIEPTEADQKVITRLQIVLEEASVDSTQIMAYLEEVSKKKKLSVRDTAASALDSSDIFVKHYAKWLKEA